MRPILEVFVFPRRVVVLSACAAALAFSSSAQASSCPGADVLPSTAPATARTATLCLLNEVRHDHRLGRLRTNRRLALAAARHARDMVERRYFAHDSLDGRTFASRIKATGYLHRANGWSVGENLAWGAAEQSTPRQIMAAWMASTGHRRNILNPRYTQIGVAVITDAPVAGIGSDAATYTTEFGDRN